MTTETATPADAPPQGVSGMDAAQTAIDSTTPKGHAEGRGRAPVEPQPPDIEQAKDLDAPPPEPEPDAEAEAPPPEPKPDLLARARAAADKAKRDKARRQREAQEAVRLRNEREQFARQAAWERQQREIAEARAREVEQADPVEYLRRRGVDPRKVVEQALEADTPEGRIRAAEERVAARERAIQEQIQRQAQQAEAERQAKAAADFVAVARDVESYPTLAKLAKSRPQSIVREAEEAMGRAYQQTGRYPSFEEICEYLEWDYSRALKEEKREAAESKGPGQGGKTTPEKAGQPATRATTLTSRANERAQLSKSVDDMTRDEQLEYFAAKARELART